MILLPLLIPPSPHVATGLKGMVVSDEPLATQVGVQILRQGGNAVDAAVATGLALAVVQPTAGNLGGGGFMLVRMANGRKLFLDYRERAPQAATRDMYLGPDGNALAARSQDGLLAAGVPGTPLGFSEAIRIFGRLRWRDVVAPAVELASRGFPLSETQANALRGQAERLSAFPNTKRIYLRGGRLYQAGERVKLPELAATLTRLRDQGVGDFYKGETARLIDADMRRRGGIIRRSDLAAYTVRTRQPLTTTYRGHTILTAPPPSSGGIVLIEVLNQLSLRPASVDPVHFRVEAMRRAYADRAEFLGDTDFVSVPVSRLTSMDHARAWAKSIQPRSTTPSDALHSPLALVPEHEETTHYSVVDRDGNCVSNTYTLNGSFGSGDTVTGTGILMNNEMDDFTSKPGSPNMYGLIQSERNAIQPGKHPLSSMTPTIVLRGGQPVLLLGSPGGSTIPNTTLNVLLNVLDGRMDVARAVAAPRMHHQWLPDELVLELGFPSAIRTRLAGYGHQIRDRRSIGICNAISINPKTHRRTGAADRLYPNATAVAE